MTLSSLLLLSYSPSVSVSRELLHCAVVRVSSLALLTLKTMLAI